MLVRGSYSDKLPSSGYFKMVELVKYHTTRGRFEGSDLALGCCAESTVLYVSGKSLRTGLFRHHDMESEVGGRG